MTVGDLLEQTVLDDGGFASRFPATSAIMCSRRLQSGLDLEKSALLGKYVVAVGFEASTYFLCPDKSVWCNGLDGQTTLSKTLAVFDSLEEALKEIVWRWGSHPETLYAAAFRLDELNDDVCAKEVIRLDVSVAERAFGPILYVEDGERMNLPDWCIPDTRWGLPNIRNWNKAEA